MSKISIIIKTLNEEKNIERAVESSLRAIAPHGGEVIVADSASTDQTVARAAKFPVIVAQLSNPEERCCGIGPQLGYQHSAGEYIYVLDGDMDLDASFVTYACNLLDHEQSIAGVGGYVREMRVENLEFEARVRRQLRRMSKQDAEVESLSGGGLYRRSAIEQVGYLSDRNLHSFEEYDLGARLLAEGWRLIRSERHAADHYSYVAATHRLLWSRIRSGYIFGVGELLRSAISGHYFTRALCDLNALRIAIAVWVYWGAAIAIACSIPAGWGAGLLTAALLLPIAAMAIRTRSLSLGFHSVLLWHVSAVGLIIGLMRRRVSPTTAIASRTIAHGGIQPDNDFSTAGGASR